jgi:hypothetical protein
MRKKLDSKSLRYRPATCLQQLRKITVIQARRKLDFFIYRNQHETGLTQAGKKYSQGYNYVGALQSRKQFAK